MAERNIVVNEILCFVQNRYGKVGDNQLIDIMRQFYDIMSLHFAKMKLVEDIDRLPASGRRPYVTTQPPLSKQVSIVIEDILDLFQFVDTELSLDALPIYVVKDIDQVPTTKSLDGESHQLIMTRVVNLEKENAELRNSIDSVSDLITSKLSSLSGLFFERISDIENQMLTNFTYMKDQLAELGDFHGISRALVGDIQLPRESTVIEFEQSATNSSGLTSGRVECVPVPPTSCDTQHQSVTHGQSSLQVAAELSSVELFTDRTLSQQVYSVSDQQLPEYTDTFANEINTDNAFQHKVSRGKRKPARQASREQTTLQDISAPTRVQVIGRHAGQPSKIKSSGRIVGKRVFAVTNVSCDCNINDIRSFLSDKHIAVLSCFEAKSKYTTSKSFRICITVTDLDTFLDPGIWPEQVVVRDWFFSAKTQTIR